MTIKLDNIYSIFKKLTETLMDKDDLPHFEKYVDLIQIGANIVIDVMNKLIIQYIVTATSAYLFFYSKRRNHS